MKPTNTRDPEYYHKVVDCQYACPAHTPFHFLVFMNAGGIKEVRFPGALSKEEELLRQEVSNVV